MTTKLLLLQLSQAMKTENYEGIYVLKPSKLSKGSNILSATK